MFSLFSLPFYKQYDFLSVYGLMTKHIWIEVQKQTYIEIKAYAFRVKLNNLAKEITVNEFHDSLEIAPSFPKEKLKFNLQLSEGSHLQN